MLIAVSSFGESFRRVLPHRPGGSDFKRQLQGFLNRGKHHGKH